MQRHGASLARILQALHLPSFGFRTVIYIPLEKGAGVLEIGTKELVPKSESGILYQILGFMNGLATQGPSRREQILCLSSQAGTKSLPNDVLNQYWDADEQYKSASMVESSGDITVFQHPSNTSSYWSSTSATSSSTPSDSDQMGNNSNTTFALITSPAQVSSMNNEDMVMSPASSLPNSMVNSFDELHVPDQLEHIDIHGISARLSLPDLDSYGVNNAELVYFSHDHHHLSHQLPLNFSSTDAPAAPPLLSLWENSPYLDPHSEPNTHDNHLFGCVLQPMQCARNDCHVDAGSSKEPYMVCPAGVTTFPSVACQANSSHSASYRHDQQQQWRCMFPCINEGERMTDLFGQSEQHAAQAMVSAAISKLPLGEDNSPGNKRLGANINHEIMEKQGAAVMVEDKGSATSSRNRKLNMDDKMSNDEGEKMVVSSTWTTQPAAGRYVSYASCSAEAEKVVALARVLSSSYGAGGLNPGSAEADRVVGLSRSKAAGSYVSYPSGPAKAEKVIGPSQDTGSYAYASAEAYNKVVGSSTSQGAGGYVGYASCSAEAEKVVASSTVFQSSYGAGGLNTGSGRQQDDQYNASSFTNLDAPHEINPAQVNHVHAERKRRRKQSDCIKTLGTLLPNITKKDKVSILESAIRHLKELKASKCELEQDNLALMKLSFKDQRKSSKDSRQNESSQENSICYYGEDTVPHFQLNLIKNVQDVNVNAFLIEIMNALQERNLFCYEINSEFWKDTSKLSMKILANYKDGGNYSPTLDEIQHIEQWWKQRRA